MIVFIKAGKEFSLLNIDEHRGILNRAGTS